MVDVNERIKINNEIISDEKISLYMDDLKQFESENNIELAYFETLFLTSCKLFLESKADYFIVEAGIGGLYDTTSILNVDTVCITNVNYDHMDLLGESLEEIFIKKSKYQTIQNVLFLVILIYMKFIKLMCMISLI